MRTSHIIAVCAMLLVSTATVAQNHARGQLKVGAAKVDVTPAPNQLGRNSYVAQVFEVLSSGYKQGYAEAAIVNGLLEMIHDATH